MIKQLLNLFLLFAPALVFSQVGIGTTTPNADLHISGSNSTIRIEGLNATNNVYNDGVGLKPVSVDGLGNFTLIPQSLEPLKFLAEENNFIPDNPDGLNFNSGTIINNGLTTTTTEGVITTKQISVSRPATLEVNYAVTILLSNTNLGLNNIAPISDGSARTVEIYFSIDLNSDGLDSTEASKKYGIKGLYYSSSADGVAGYAYLNSQGYVTVPDGNHILHFYGVVKDGTFSNTSVGFGGSRDYLKIRVYN